MNAKRRPNPIPQALTGAPPAEIQFSPEVVAAAEKSAGRRLRYDVVQPPRATDRRD
jgi:hypothetical protein